MRIFLLHLICAIFLLPGLARPALAQAVQATTLTPPTKSQAADLPFRALEGKWVRYAGTSPMFIEILTRDGKPHAQFISQKSGKPLESENVNYKNGELSFDLPGTPVPTFKVRLTPGGATLTGEMVISGFPYPIPVVMEKVDTWPTAEQIAARGPAGPAIVRK